MGSRRLTPMATTFLHFVAGEVRPHVANSRLVEGGDACRHFGWSSGLSAKTRDDASCPATFAARSDV